MLYALISTDKPDSLQLRMDARAAHLEHIKSLGDTIKAAGPFTSDDGEKMNGSMLIVEAGSIEEARAIAERDPYFKADLFADVQVRPWNWTVGNPDRS